MTIAELRRALDAAGLQTGATNLVRVPTVTVTCLRRGNLVGGFKVRGESRDILPLLRVQLASLGLAIVREAPAKLLIELAP